MYMDFLKSEGWLLLFSFFQIVNIHSPVKLRPLATVKYKVTGSFTLSISRQVISAEMTDRTGFQIFSELIS
jgi:hypothetical protein